ATAGPPPSPHGLLPPESPMRQSLLRRLQAFLSPATPSLRRAKRRHKPRLERLEERVTPTATLYVDFCDRFPSRALSRTLSATRTAPPDNTPRRSTPAHNRLDLPHFGYTPSDPIHVQSFNSSHKGNTAADLASRPNIMTLVRRYYEPLDVTVVELTAQPQMV